MKSKSDIEALSRSSLKQYIQNLSRTDLKQALQIVDASTLDAALESVDSSTLRVALEVVDRPTLKVGVENLSYETLRVAVRLIDSATLKVAREVVNASTNLAIDRALSDSSGTGGAAGGTAPTDEDDHVIRKVELGTLPFGVPEFKVEWEGIKPITYTRTSQVTAYAEFKGPDNIVNDSWNDIRSCALSSLGVATVAGIVGDPAAALPAFKAAFVACITAKIGAKANEIHVALTTEQTSGDWTKV